MHWQQDDKQDATKKSQPTLKGPHHKLGPTASRQEPQKPGATGICRALQECRVEKEAEIVVVGSSPATSSPTIA